MVAVIFHLSAGCISCLVLSTAACSPQEKGKRGFPADFSSFRREGNYMQVFQSNLSLCTPTNFFSVCLFHCRSLCREMDVCSTSEIWCTNMQGYLSVDIICSEKRTIFREHSSRKTVRFPEQIISKYIFAPNGDYCVYYPSNLFHTASSFENWGPFCHVTC